MLEVFAIIALCPEPINSPSPVEPCKQVQVYDGQGAPVVFGAASDPAIFEQCRQVVVGVAPTAKQFAADLGYQDTYVACEIRDVTPSSGSGS